MTITTATDADAQAILELQRLAYRSEAELHGDDTLPPLTETLDQIRAEIGNRRPPLTAHCPPCTAAPAYRW